MPRLSITTALPSHDKPLPKTPPGGLPSPTLTNPDYILPSSALPVVQSPPRLTRRPPSPSYLRDESLIPQAMAAKKERHQLGLMSRKMLLLRTRTSSGGQINGKGALEGSQSQDLIPSSPVLQDVGNLAPEQPDHLQTPELDHRSVSGGSSSSDVSGMTTFLATYDKPDRTSDDGTMYEGGGRAMPLHSDDITEDDGEADAERMKQQQEELHSAILSKRAEQILANAKKRLNVMEGNLRGARDLVAPLTAANLKRATSLGSAQHQPTYGRRQTANGLDYDEQDLYTPPNLHTQSSSPAIGREYQGHARGFSETDMPGRLTTTSGNPHHMMSRNIRAPTQSAEPSPGNGLRGSKSYDSLGASNGMGYGMARDRSLHSRDSPDSSPLETLQEADERKLFRLSGSAGQDFANNGLGNYRPSSRTTDLREQMSSLKGKISDLKERAREESLRRHSQTNLRNASPFNNAIAPAPEFFFTASTTHGTPVPDMNSGLGRTSNSGSHTSSQKQRANGEFISRSRNASSQQAASLDHYGLQQTHVDDVLASKTPKSKFQIRQEKQIHTESPITHRRTRSGTTIVDPAKNRYTHHQQKNSREIPSTYVDGEQYGLPSTGLPNGQYGNSSPTPSESTQFVDEDGYAPSEADSSVYEDAMYEQSSVAASDDGESEHNAVLAHEDREDAFDYEHFFLHSAMGSYRNDRRNSGSSEASVSSVETAKGPVLVGDEEDDDFHESSILYPPPTPETPERLRQIERNIHKRTFSDESTTTVDTFATAKEDVISPIDDVLRRLSHGEQYSVSPMEDDAPTDQRIYSPVPAMTSSRPDSRPGTAVWRPARRDGSSDRADSGVGLPHRSIVSADSQHPTPGSNVSKSPRGRPNTSINATPPTSPRAVVRPDPVTVAVHALLDPNGKALGLRNKAVLFGVIESLRNVVHHLQEVDEAHYESRMLRRKLDDAKFALDGRNTY